MINTYYAEKKNKYANKISSTTTKIPSTPTKEPITLTKILRCFVARQFLSQIHALFWRTFSGQKYGGVPKRIKSQVCLDALTEMLLTG